MSKLASDILSTPVTIVSLESTFSASRRVIDPHKASLSTKIMQMLVCGVDWVRALHMLKNKCTVNFTFVYKLIGHCYSDYSPLNL